MNPTLQKTFWFPKVELAQVNRVSRQREDASGKGINVTRVLTQLGEPAVHVTQVGGAGADLFLELARGDKLDVRPVHAEIEIRNCYTLLDAGAGTTTELVEAGDHVPDGVEDEVRRTVIDLLGGARSLVLSGSKAPGFSSELYPGLVERALAAGLFVLVDVRGEDLIRSLRQNDRHCLISEVRPAAMEIFRNSGLLEVAGEENVFSDEISNPTLSTAKAMRRAMKLLEGQKAEVKIF
ncbi:MAG: PfkB family carbohydrate kinase, partial [Spirochaetota bacterium]